MPAALDRAANLGGRRTKTSKGGNRGTGEVVVPRALWGFERRQAGVSASAGHAAQLNAGSGVIAGLWLSRHEDCLADEWSEESTAGHVCDRALSLSVDDRRGMRLAMRVREFALVFMTYRS